MAFALITGASKGIGKAIAYNLAAKGYNLLLVARSQELLHSLAIDLHQHYKTEVHVLSLDLSEKEAATSIWKWCQQKAYPVSILINNAGYGLSGLFESYPLEEHLNMMQLNMNALVELTYHFLPLLKQQPKGYIMNIASSAAYQAVPYLSVYAATKAFVLQFSRGLKYELRKSNVSITCISPGATDTEFVNRANVGPKGLKAAGKLNMTPVKVAEIAVDSMLKGKTEVITGALNKVGAFFAGVLPKTLVEKTAANIYE